jgi:hypothetical protein
MRGGRPGGRPADGGGCVSGSLAPPLLLPAGARRLGAGRRREGGGGAARRVPGPRERAQESRTCPPRLCRQAAAPRAAPPAPPAQPDPPQARPRDAGGDGPQSSPPRRSSAQPGPHSRLEEPRRPRTREEQDVRAPLPPEVITAGDLADPRWETQPELEMLIRREMRTLDVAPRSGQVSCLLT